MFDRPGVYRPLPAFDLREQLGPGFKLHVIGVFDVNLCPGAAVDAFMQAIVEQPCVAFHRDALAGSTEISLGRDRVLVVAEVVADICDGLRNGRPQIGRVSVFPLWQDDRKAIFHQPVETAEVLSLQQETPTSPLRDPL